jgi:hypothetical protein
MCEAEGVKEELKGIFTELTETINIGFEQVQKGLEIRSKLNKLAETKLENVTREWQIEKIKIKESKLREKSLEETINELEKALYKRMVAYRDLEDEIEKEKEKQHTFLGKYDEIQIMDEIRELFKENEEQRNDIRELRSEINYGKQRENKLMYFLFLMQQKNYPVFDQFEKFIKDLPTRRFSAKLNEDYKQLFLE